MKIILANGKELNPIMVTGGNQYIQGASRDTLTFVFDGAEGLDAIDAAFTAEACESITIVEDGGEEYIHKGYTIRAELKKTQVEAEAATPESDVVMVDRITVSMSQRTYAESQMASLTETVDILVMESLMA